MRGHPFAGQIYPVSRSAAEVQGLKAYPSVEALPKLADLAILIVPAEYVPAELDRCGRAGIKRGGYSQFRLCRGRRSRPTHAARDRRDCAALRHGSERAELRRLCQHRGCAVRELQPGVRQERRAAHTCRPLGRGQVSVISQSGGLGFAFLDRARPRNFKFRYIVTTGNEAMLEIADFVDYMLDEGATDVFLLLIEAVKTPEKFQASGGEGAQSGQADDRRQDRPDRSGPRAVASHTAALAGSQAAYRAIFDRYGLIEGRDFDEMLDLAAVPRVRRSLAGRDVASVSAPLPAAPASGWPTLARPRGSMCPCSMMRRVPRLTLSAVLWPRRRIQSIPPLKACRKLGYAQFARLVAGPLRLTASLS